MQVALLALALVVPTVLAISDKSDIPGRYCALRTPSCCSARQDTCSVPIMGTLCYCDDFCAQHLRDDCCPDYPYVCLNYTTTMAPPSTIQQPVCVHKGISYPMGTGFKINCNKCNCQQQCDGRDCRMEMKCDNNPCLLIEDIITNINQDRFAGWTAANYSQFWGRTLNEGFRRRLGTRHSKRRAYSMRSVNPVFDREGVRRRLWYDLRSERPNMISPPLDQGWCAADWVISTVQVATDRLTLVSKGEDRARLSPQHLLSCNSKNQFGCDGGHITRAWKFIQKFGLVPEACYPWVGQQTNCSISKVRDKKRTTARCAYGNAFMPLHRTGPAYRVSKEPENIMYEIMTSGPVQANMYVTQDFFTYRTGIYRCPLSFKNRRPVRGNETLPYHAVRIVGWGEDVQMGKLVKYWIVSNSWGTWWGENGYFRIVRGANECEIESLVLGSWINPIVPKKDPSMPMMDRNMMSNTLS